MVKPLAKPVCVVLAGILLSLVTAPARALPEVQSWAHSSGAPVYFVEATELAIVDIAVSFVAGSARDGDQYGLAHLTAQLLDDGADGAPADAVAETFAKHAASFSVTVDRDRMELKLRSLSDEKHLQPALQQLAAVLQRPDFPQQAIAREQARVQAQLQAQEQSPGDLADKKLYEAIYGSHPYAHSVTGTKQAVAGIDRARMLQFHNSYLVAANASVAVVGDVDRMKVQQLVRRLLDGLPPGEKAESVSLDMVVDNAATTEKILFPSTQNHIMLGHIGVAIDNPDRLALYMGNHILGSGMVSRLFKSIREQHGLAYSVYSYFLPLQSAGPFIVGMQTEASQAEQSVQLLRQQLREYIATGPTEQELEDAKSYIRGTFVNRFSSNAKLASYLSWMAFYGLPPDYLQQFIPWVQEISTEHIRQSFEKYIRIDELYEVQVGRES